MEIVSLDKELSSNSYPGRGIIIGKGDTANGENLVVAYFIMGRSVNSRNRIFEEFNGGIKTRAFDEALLTDPSLIIYSPVRLLNGGIVVTNGDQTDTICDFIEQGKTFEEALRTRQFEPDPPNYTPRISGIVDTSAEQFSYKLSILKSANGDPTADYRYFYEYTNPIAGQGHFIHTYRCDGDPIPSFEGEPKLVKLEGDIDSFTKTLWDNLNGDNKVSLFTRYVDLKTGTEQTRIVNRNK